MGYYTHYRLTIAPETFIKTRKQMAIVDGERREVDIEEEVYLIDTLREACKGDYLYSSLEDSDDMKWYEHESDLRSLSIQYPEVLFTLNGTGEVSGDIWVKFFKYGKMQHSKAEVVLDEIDANKLR